ncbi:MAG: mannitol dehydrogenase family protein [Butyrivibrio sp.]|jgi:fructuronate reductase|uniref:mannitol dehydrogenase family protein n=1 Tax=Butyrivibrio sp. LB2008 TaxID=1408305 RepID=UPI00047B2BA6|nr:mannitol dehydrogenase family protein [Butyrivibrio sp. LB2008]MEE3495291.1 mannitol dehydrogenase family protein [Butyrivibrio sp.]
MKLNANSVATDNSWKEKGYYLPTFNKEDMIKKTVEAPEWVHFGAGNIFRAFQANLAQRMLDGGMNDKGLTVVEGFDYEIIEKMYRPHDNLSLLVTLKADGSVEKSVIASIAESCILDSNDDKEFNRLKEIFRCDSLQLATFTITEKGYSLVNPAGELLAAVKDDFVNGPSKPQSYIGKVAALLYERFLAGEKKIAMVSTDNCSHNGDKLFDAVHAFAKEWAANGKAEEGFVAYIEDDSKVSFPWSMIDKITPRPDDSVNEILKNDGVEELEPVVTSKKTWVAPFVNAEESEYLVIEDKFPNGRPALEKVGVIFTDKETVDKVERMKVCTCLNPLHTALAVYGCLLGYDKISEEMKDEELVKLVKTIGYVEGLPVVTDPGVIKPQEFIDTVVNVRIPNKFMPDTPQRIATDTSQKLAIRFGETIKAYMASSELNVADLKCIPLVHAGWLRYLMGVDDNGNSFEPSPDPLLEKAQAYVQDIKLGGEYDKETLKNKVLPLLKDATIFGTDLEAAGLSDIIIGYFEELIAGTGAVRNTLKNHV